MRKRGIYLYIHNRYCGFRKVLCHLRVSIGMYLAQVWCLRVRVWYMKIRPTVYPCSTLPTTEVMQVKGIVAEDFGVGRQGGRNSHLFVEFRAFTYTTRNSTIS